VTPTKAPGTRARKESADDELERLRNEAEHYRRAAEDALQQLDWCIGYLHGLRKVKISAALAKNRAHIRTQLLDRPEQPDPALRTSET